MDFAWHLEDRATGERGPISSLEDAAAWFAAGPRETDLILERNGRTQAIPLPPCVAEEPGQIFEVALETPGDDGLDPRTRYTQGDCEVFAAALEETLQGQGIGFIAVYDRMEPGSTRVTRGVPYLIHAGYQFLDRVYDVDGCHRIEEWASRWMENGQCSEKSGWGPVTLKRLEAMQKQRMTKEQVAEAAPYASLVVALAVPWPEPDSGLDFLPFAPAIR